MKTSKTQNKLKKTPKTTKKPPKPKLLFTETFQLFDRSLKTLLKSSKYLGFGTIKPPSFPANIAECQQIFILGPELSFFFLLML